MEEGPFSHTQLGARGPCSHAELRLFAEFIWSGPFSSLFPINSIKG